MSFEQIWEPAICYFNHISINCSPTEGRWVRESHNDHSATRCLRLHKTLGSGTSTQLFLCIHSEGRQAGVSRISLPVTPPGRINKRECTILDRARQRQGQGREADQHLSTHYAVSDDIVRSDTSEDVHQWRKSH